MVVVIRLFQKQAAKGLQPLGQYFADGNQGAVLINCRFCEPVFVVEKMGFVTIGQNFGEVCESLLVAAAERYCKLGFLQKVGERIAFTPKGFLVSNTILAELI